jgi:hypothetical protein
MLGTNTNAYGYIGPVLVTLKKVLLKLALAVSVVKKFFLADRDSK